MTDAAPGAPAEGQAQPGQGNPPPAPPPAGVKPYYDGWKDEDVGYVKNKGWDGNDGPLKAIESYRNLEKFQGVPPEQLLKLPKDPSEAGAMDPIYERLGRPKDPKDYGEFKAEGVEVDANRLGHFDKVFHGMGLNKAQRDAAVKATIEYESGVQAEYAKALDAAQAAQMNTLKQEWGTQFEERAELGRRAVKAFLPEGVNKDELLNAMEGALGSANMLKMFSNMADKANLKEGLINDSQGRSFGYSPEQAKSDMSILKAEVQGNKERLAAFNEGKGADYEKMQRLMKVAHGIA